MSRIDIWVKNGKRIQHNDPCIQNDMHMGCRMKVKCSDCPWFKYGKAEDYLRRMSESNGQTGVESK